MSLTETHVREGIEIGTTFCDGYYTAMDKNRAILDVMYGPDATVVWNGNEIKRAQLGQFLGALPTSNHNRLVQDVQLSVETLQPGFSLLVVVKGNVAIGSDPWTPFTQNFILTNPTPANKETWRIKSDCFRHM